MGRGIVIAMQRVEAKSSQKIPSTELGLFMGLSRQECWSGWPFPSPVDHVLSELSTMIRPSWMSLHGMAHSSIELGKAVAHVIRLVSFLWLCLSALWRIKTSGLWKLPDGRDWLRGRLGLVLMGGAMLSISLIQFSGLNTAAILLRGPGCVPSLLFDLRPNYTGGNEDDGHLLQKSPHRHCCTRRPSPCRKPQPAHTSPKTPGHS